MRGLHPRLQAVQALLADAPLTRIVEPEIDGRGLELWLKRDDLLHPVISGNKWRKLKYLLNHALFAGADTLVSMGGAYSNHLHALAFCGKVLGLQTMAYIRGERPALLNPTLLDLQEWGMALLFVSRGDYRKLRQFKAYDGLPGLAPGQYWLPEGGATGLALQGVAEIVAEIDIDYDVLAVACGTGTTMAGLIAAAPRHTQVLGVAALKGGGFLSNDIEQILTEQGKLPNANWKILLDYHAGGFAKATPALLSFIADFQRKHDIALEPVYTGKLLFGLYDLIKQGHFPAGTRIVAIHTGGLQGNRSQRQEHWNEPVTNQPDIESEPKMVIIAAAQ